MEKVDIFALIERELKKCTIDSVAMKTVEAQMTTAFVRLRKELGWLLCFIFIQNF